MFLELLFGLITFLFLWDYIHKKRYNVMIKAANIPGPKALPLVGNALIAVGNDTEKLFLLMKKLRDEFGKIWHLWFFHEGTLFVQDAKYIESILSSQQVITKSGLYDLLKMWLGDGLLLSTGSKWHSRRKIITPTFHFKILEQFVEVFDQQAGVLVKKLTERADGKTIINIFPVICLTALDIIAETAMGVKIDAQIHPEFPYASALTDVADIMSTRFIKVHQRFNLVFNILRPRTAKRLRRNIDVMQSFTNKVIAERRNTLSNEMKNEKATDDDDIGQKKRMAFLDVLLQATVNGKPLGNEDIREEVETFMFEGHDTTTSGISHTCYLIARHPEVQKKLFDEIRSVIGDDKDRPISMRELNDLKYLECVIKEGLRMYPPVPIIGRRTDDDVVINGKLIPKRTNISVLLYAALRDPDYFNKPDDFIPERFSPDSTEKIDPFAYVPFSAGPRNCIGQKFATLEMKSTISKLLRHYEFLPLGENVRSVMNLILRSSNGINLGLKPRVYA